jgi:UDP-N-acetylmuramoyl-tripeptide--D-alanyl-D-alanine ligase
MRELGAEAERSHREVGVFAAGCVDDLITVGRDAQTIAKGALDAGMKPGHVMAVATWQDAARAAVGLVRTGTVLVKGSRAVGLEHVVAALIADGVEAT